MRRWNEDLYTDGAGCAAFFWAAVIFFGLAALDRWFF